MPTHRLAEAAADRLTSIYGSTGRRLPSREDIVAGMSEALDYIEELGERAADEQQKYLHQLNMDLAVPSRALHEAVSFAENCLKYARQEYMSDTMRSRSG